MSFADALDLGRVRGRAKNLPKPSLSGLKKLPKPNVSAVKKFRPTRRGVLLALLITFLLAAISFVLVRNSGLVKVEQVKVAGLDGYYDKAARRAVIAEAQQMTTMNVDEDRLAEAASAFVDVSAVKVNSDFPHKLTIYLDVRRAVAAARIGNEVVGLTGSGLILASPHSLSGVPVIEVAGPLKDEHITDAKALGAVKALAAAPDVLLRKVKSVDWGRNGLLIVLDKGVELYFGDASRAIAKWRAVAAVLADPAARGASYIDLRAPDRPAVGGLGAAPVTVKPSDLSDTTITEPSDPAIVGSTPDAAPAPQATTPQAPAATAPQQAPPTTPQQAPAAGGAAPPSSTGQ